MKLCWDNLNDLDYIGNNTWKRVSTNHYFIIKDKCIGCGNEFLTYKYDNADYCSKTCARIYSNPMKIPKVKEIHKLACNKPEHIKKIREHHKGKKRPEHSKFMKENNPMFNDDVRKKHSEIVSSNEYKKRMSNIIKIRWEDEDYRMRYEHILMEKGLKRPDYVLNKVEKYRRKVKVYTNKTIIKYFDKINPNNYSIGIGDGFYNIDHIYSIVDGFENNVDPKIIGSVVNLQVLTSKENILKYSDSWISKDELLSRFNNYENNI